MEYKSHQMISTQSNSTQTSDNEEEHLIEERFIISPQKKNRKTALSLSQFPSDTSLDLKKNYCQHFFVLFAEFCHSFS